MSVLDDEFDVTVEDIYTNKITNFFKKNGTMGRGILSTFKVNSELLFKWTKLENLLANPSEYYGKEVEYEVENILYSTSNEDTYFICILERNYHNIRVSEWRPIEYSFINNEGLRVLDWARLNYII